MVKKFLILFVLIVVVLCWLIFKNVLYKYEIVEFNLNGKTYRLYLADTPKKQQHGLMNIKKKPVNIDGMLFKFPMKSYRVFYNKNTYLDLDIYWIKDSSVVGKNFLPSLKTSGGVIVYVSSPQEVDTVVELIR